MENLEELSPQLAKILREKERSETPDYSKYRLEAASRWQDAVEGGDFAEYLVDILKKFTLLPRADKQWRIVASYLALPTALCAEITKWDIPILFSHGNSGSGKSDLGKIAAIIHATRPIGSGSSFASMRNEITSSILRDSAVGDTPGNWRNGALIWEDIDVSMMLRQEGLVLALLKNGISRTGQITIAAEAGTNLSFPVYCPKYISSIHAVYSHYACRELIRRVIVIQHKPFHQWLESDSSEFYGNVDPSDLFKLSDFDWDGFSEEFEDYWRNTINLERFAYHAKHTRLKRKHGIPDIYWNICKHLITVGLVCEFWSSLDEAIKDFKDYFTWHDENVASQTGATQRLLKEYIDSLVESQLKNQEALRKLGAKEIPPLELNPDEITAFLKQEYARGTLDTNITPRERTMVMNSLDWFIDEKSRKWVKR